MVPSAAGLSHTLNKVHLVENGTGTRGYNDACFFRKIFRFRCSESSYSVCFSIQNLEFTVQNRVDSIQGQRP